MSSNPTILIQIIAKDGATAVAKQVDSSIKQLGNDVKRTGQEIVDSSRKTDEGFRGLVHTSDIFGLRMRDVAHVATGAFAGIDTAISAISGKVDEGTKHILDMAQGVEHVGTAFLFLGPVGGLITGIGVAVGFVLGETQKLDQAVAAAQAPFNEIEKSLALMPTATQEFASSLGMAETQLKQFAQSSTEARTHVQELLEIEKQAASVQAQYSAVSQAQSQTYGMLNRNAAQYGVSLQGIIETLRSAPSFISGFITAAQTAVGITGNFSGALADLEEKTIKAEYAAAMHTAAVREEAAAMAAGASARSQGMNDIATREITDATEAQRLFAAGAITLQDALTRIDSAFGGAGSSAEFFKDQLLSTVPILTGTSGALINVNTYTELTKLHEQELNERVQHLKDSLNEQTQAALKNAQAWQQLKDRLKGIVEGVVTPTSVDARMKREGDAWDEFRLRLEADMTGTNLAERAWGAQFSATLAQVQQKTGLSLQQIDAKFKDFSLFANKDVMMTPGLVDWGAIVGDTADAVNQIIGKYNLVKQGVDAYLASPEAQFQLPNLAQALGISTAGVDTAQLKQQVSQALTGALGGITGGAEGGAAAAVKTTMVFDAKKAITDAGMLKKDIADIPASLKGETVKTIQDLSKSSTFDATLTTIISDLNKIPEELNATVTIVYRSSSPPAAASNEAGTAAGAAKTVPTYGLGGYVPKTGLAFLHKDEYVVPPGGLPPPSMQFGGGGGVTTGGSGGVHFHAHADFRLPSESELARDLVEVMRRDPSELLRLYERLVAEWGRMTRAKAANGQV